MLQTITLEQVKAGARDYYQRKLLIAQMPKRKRRLVYGIGDYRCAISTVFTSKTMAALEAKGLRDGAITEGLVQVEPRNDRTEIERIQNAHDDWALHSSSSTQKKRFLKLIE